MDNLPSYIVDAIKGLEENDPRYINLNNMAMDDSVERLKAIPWEHLPQHKAIRFLTATNQEISEVEKEIGQLSDLEHLDLSGNPLIALPEEIGQCTKLKSVRISDAVEVDGETYLELLTAGPGHRPEFLSEAGLTRLPSSFGQLKQLTNLQLDGNRFEQIPAAVFELNKLASLDLSANLLSSVAPEIGQLSNLTYLKLSRNNFHELPESIGQLKNLQRLRLDSLHLNSLPESIGKLKNLQMLEICQGIIEAIPTSIQLLQNLKYFYLVDTQIDDIDLNLLKVFLPKTSIRFKAGF